MLNQNSYFHQYSLQFFLIALRSLRYWMGAQQLLQAEIGTQKTRILKSTSV
ncbi:MAG: hypothetical protein CM15mP66_10060 [Pseudomonadota bacterium]|nr:MAG: hypothetical protein CM15mP66_10060 [Pseudomonadota bacterium]